MTTATGSNSDVYIQPVALFNDPFRGGENKIVLCETLAPDQSPHPTNTRRAAFETFNKKVPLSPRSVFQNMSFSLCAYLQNTPLASSLITMSSPFFFARPPIFAERA